MVKRAPNVFSALGVNPDLVDWSRVISLLRVGSAEILARVGRGVDPQSVNLENILRLFRERAPVLLQRLGVRTENVNWDEVRLALRQSLPGIAEQFGINLRNVNYEHLFRLLVARGPALLKELGVDASRIDWGRVVRRLIRRSYQLVLLSRSRSQ